MPSLQALRILHGKTLKNSCTLCSAVSYCCGAVAPCAIAALLGRFLPRLGPLVYSSGPFFFCVPGAMQRVALAKRCFAEPGPRFLSSSPEQPGPRLCSAPLRKSYALRSVRGTKWRSYGNVNPHYRRHPDRARPSEGGRSRSRAGILLRRG